MTTLTVTQEDIDKADELRKLASNNVCLTCPTCIASIRQEITDNPYVDFEVICHLHNREALFRMSEQLIEQVRNWTDMQGFKPGTYVLYPVKSGS